MIYPIRPWVQINFRIQYFKDLVLQMIQVLL